MTGTQDRMIYFFGRGEAEGDPSRKDLLGGKGASLAAMSAAGLPVPPGFTISVACCRHFHQNERRWPEGLEEGVRQYLERLQDTVGRPFGAGARPLLVSVRSGAAQSMPGMMDTILNCGLHRGLADQVPDADRFWQVYAGFVRQFAATVADIPPDDFAAAGDTDDRRRAEAWTALYEERTGRAFPRTPWDALRECIEAVFDSWHNEQAIVYRRAHGLEHLEGTAVTVQSMFDSRVSGIAFTANPVRPDAGEMVIESSYGLGESIVSGDVEPDRFVLDAGTFEIKQRSVGRKQSAMLGLSFQGEDPCARADGASLTDPQLAELAAIARRVEDYFGHPVDLEWGIDEGGFALLQARPVRGLDVARDVERGRLEEIERLRASLDGGHRVWIVHNLSETLSAPRPLTWDIVRGFMRGDGGYGRMYQDLGYRLSRRVREEGFLELICGRIYTDPERAAEQFWAGLPVRYDPDDLLKDPSLVESAPTQFDAARADQKFLLRLPGTLWGMFRSRSLTARARRNAVRHFEDAALPPYLDYVEEKRRQDLSFLDADGLVRELHDRIARVMDEFGDESLKPGYFGGIARAELQQRLEQLLGPVEGQRMANVLTSGLDGNVTVEQNALQWQVAAGEADAARFLDLYGHRAVGEMELANPRYREAPPPFETAPGESPEERHRRAAAARKEAMADLPRLLKECGGSCFREEVESLAREAQELLPYREIGKHYLMMGYELIRSVCVALGERFRIGGGVFFLHLDELARFEAERDELVRAIEARKRRWQSQQKLDLPDAIDSAALDSLGLPRHLEGATELEAVPLSAGVVDGTVAIVRHPSEAGELPADCILVCPSTDPAWTALFTRIRGLVVERGGVLSHGAITARDFGIPAVACPDATAIIADGARVRVDGDRGRVTLIGGADHA
ncbi:MAG: hypothetical protein GXY85_12850 [Candidatus Brocadiaceae bacterium]|nr:hypothetical protein [Candidatus Brocadiaceae bacterium]